MNFLLFPQKLIAVIRLASTMLVAGVASSPMSWSPDGDWLTYTVVARQDHDRLQPGCIFDTGTEATAQADSTETPPSKPSAVPAFYQLWASHRDCRQSVLIEHSRWPLSAPAWSTAGHSVAYGRFVPQSIDSSQPLERGRYEVVLQDGLDRKRVLWTIANFVMDPQARAELPHIACAWSPDGAYLAIPRPGRPHRVVIVKLDSGRAVHIAENAILPSWSPDGTRLALVHHEDDYNSIELIERQGKTFGPARALVATERFAVPAHWSTDGRSIYTLLEKPRAGSHEPEIARVFVETGDVQRMLPLLGDQPRKAPTICGVAIGFDHEAERCSTRSSSKAASTSWSGASRAIA